MADHERAPGGKTPPPQQGGGAAAKPAPANQTGDPGRTPGQAEGDEQTVDESLRDHERKEGSR